MKERPILFSAPMVRALLDGSKTQTRRVLKQATGPSLSVGMDDDAPGVAELSWLWGDGPGHEVHESTKRVPCPYGQPGDRLWVREAWRASDEFDTWKPSDLSPEHLVLWVSTDDVRISTAKGTGAATRSVHEFIQHGTWGKLRPSMFMPRWASRILLEVASVRVERLQDISEADAIAEGVSPDPILRGDDDMAVFHAIRSMELRRGRLGMSAPIARYMVLWESINGPGSWALNPWVWCVSFRRIGK